MKLTQLLHLKVHSFTLKMNSSIRETNFLPLQRLPFKGCGGRVGRVGEGMGMGSWLEVQDV